MYVVYSKRVATLAPGFRDGSRSRLGAYDTIDMAFSAIDASLRKFTNCGVALLAGKIIFWGFNDEALRWDFWVEMVNRA
jgi:hypothetical protein